MPSPRPSGQRRPVPDDPCDTTALNRPLVFFSDEASAVMRPVQTLTGTRRAFTLRPPLETLTWQAPPTPYEEQ